MESNDYSGKFVTRMAKSLHKRAALWAQREGVSLNQFIVDCVAEQVGVRARPMISVPSATWSLHVAISGVASSPISRMSGGTQQLAASVGQQLIHFPNHWSEAARA